MKVKDFIQQFKNQDMEKELLFSSDEEGNTFYEMADLSMTEMEHGQMVLVVYPYKELSI